jgi:peptidoglycan/xylan/chitin deacetylase (PgdA/CDA1 family)
MDLLAQFDVRPTFPITALPMSRHPKFAHRLLDRGAELAVHAYRHVDLTTLGYEGQSKEIARAIQIFREKGIPFSGFRAPYLHWNEDTMKVVEDYGFRYSSNLAVIWDVLEEDRLSPAEREGLERGKRFYDPLPADRVPVLPLRRRGFVEIPVSLPDDEVLLDRMLVRQADRLERLWLGILERAYQRGELFTLQLHPERIEFFTRPLSELLQRARASRPPVWVATLDEIARWWVERDAEEALLERVEGGFRVRTKRVEGSAVLLRREGREEVVEEDTFEVPAERRPCVGIAVGTPREALQALRAKGYVVEVAVPGESYAVELGRVPPPPEPGFFEAIGVLERHPGPLVRFATWPGGARCALAITGDIDALTLWDFFARFWGA